MSKVYIQIWNGIIDWVDKPDDVKITIRDYDKHCNCEHCLTDKEGHQYHKLKFPKIKKTNKHEKSKRKNV